jgi:lactobin A/cerein 7B family class IIb bacteriocin
MKELELNEIEQVNGGGAVAVVVVVLVVGALALGIYLGYEHAKQAANK